MRSPADSRASSLSVITLLSVAQIVLASCGANVTFKSNDPPPTGTGNISGAYIDDATQQPVAGAIVLLEQPDAAGVDRALMSTATATDGTFDFSGLAPGNYDLVAAASVTTAQGTVTSAATVTFLVPADSALNGMPLVAQFGDSMPYGLPVDIGAGGVITAVTANGPARVDVQLSALQRAMTRSGTIVHVTIPTLSGSTAMITTAAGANCPSGTDCAVFSLLVPSSAPVVGTYDPTETTYSNPTLGPQEVMYTVEGRAFIRGTNTPDCIPSSLTVGPEVPLGTLASKIPNLNFSACQ